MLVFSACANLNVYLRVKSVNCYNTSKIIKKTYESGGLNSVEFMLVKFFIGGAYGFEDSFLQKSDAIISLGKLTMSHKIAKVVLLEQIYRGFSILSNNPYHK
jgi:rRNA large subunit m3Psi methyltransferase RlmH